MAQEVVLVLQKSAFVARSYRFFGATVYIAGWQEIAGGKSLQCG
jgi:hypothetical protein